MRVGLWHLYLQYYQIHFPCQKLASLKLQKILLAFNIVRKDFDEWNKVKKEIDIRLSRPRFYDEGDIWWVNIGCNIGVENNGKGVGFGRPVLIIKKINYCSCLIVPLSSKKKIGYFYRKLNFKNNKNTLLFNQIRVVDTSRLIKRIGQINEQDILNIRNFFNLVFK